MLFVHWTNDWRRHQANISAAGITVEVEGFRSSQSPAPNHSESHFSGKEGSGRRNRTGQGKGTRRPLQSSPAASVLLPLMMQDQDPFLKLHGPARKLCPGQYGGKARHCQVSREDQAPRIRMSPFNWSTFPDVSQKQGSVGSSGKKMRSIYKVTDILLEIMRLSSIYNANWKSLEKYKEISLEDQRKVESFSGWVQNSFIKKVVSDISKMAE